MILNSTDYSPLPNGHLRERIKELDDLIRLDKRHMEYLQESRNCLSAELARRELLEGE